MPSRMQITIAGGLGDVVTAQEWSQGTAGERVETETLRLRAICLSSKAMHPLARAEQMIVRPAALESGDRMRQREATDGLREGDNPPFCDCLEFLPAVMLP